MPSLASTRPAWPVLFDTNADEGFCFSLLCSWQYARAESTTPWAGLPPFFDHQMVSGRRHGSHSSQVDCEPLFKVGRASPMAICLLAVSATEPRVVSCHVPLLSRFSV